MITLEDTITVLRDHDPNANIPDTLCSARFEDWEIPGEVDIDNIEVHYSAYLFNEVAKQYFEINCRDSPTSYNEVLSHTLGEGKEGHKVALTLIYEGAYNVMSTHYIYEWKKISPETDTQIEGKEVHETKIEDNEEEKAKKEKQKKRSEEFRYWWENESEKYTDEEIKAMGNIGARFGDLHGEVLIIRGCDEKDISKAVFASLDYPIQHGDMIITSRRSKAIISFDDMTWFELEEDSRVVLDLQSYGQTKLQLILGRIGRI